MDQRFLQYYNRELQFMREMGGEFARQFPKIAGRLGLDSFECADPYVERLLEGFSFLAARVQLKIDAEFPRFTQHLLNMVYPHYLAPIPSMAVVRFDPDLTSGNLAEGFPIPRGAALHGLLAKGDQTACDYRTAHDVTLWPLQLAAAGYSRRDTAAFSLPAGLDNVRAGIRLNFRATAGLHFSELALDRLPIFLPGNSDRSQKLHEQIFTNAVGVLARPGEGAPWCEILPAGSIKRVGFSDKEALFPYGPRSFQGYRLLHEYFAFQQRFMFFDLTSLRKAVQRCSGDQLEIIILLDRVEPALEKVVDAASFSLFAAPAINLFPRRADRINISRGESEHHVLPDRTRPLDLEVHSISSVTGFGSGSPQRFDPFYSRQDSGDERPEAYYTVRRTARVALSGQRLKGPRSSYSGSEVFVSLVDGRESPYRRDIDQLELQTLCTNRDLPLHMPVGKAETDFTLDIGAPVKSIRCVAGPTPPRPSFAVGDGETAWRLINHLSLNYLSIVDNDQEQGAAAIRGLLKLYADMENPATRNRIEGVRSIASNTIIRRLPLPGPISYGRGLEITLTCDENAFEGSGVFLLGAVMAEFFAKYVTLNSFTETVLRTTGRGEVKRWPATIGRRQIL